MTLISVPKPLRDKLGEEASDSLVELLQKQESEQKIHLFEVLEDRFSHRLEVAISGVRKDMGILESRMNDGFLEVTRQFTEVHKEISGIHKAISAQTKWLLIIMLAGITLYPVIQKIADKF